MKKVIIGLSALVVLTLAVVLTVNAQDNKTTKKNKTEVVAGNCKGGPATSSCCAMKDKKSSECPANNAKCDSTKMSGCDKTKSSCEKGMTGMTQGSSCCKGKTK